MEIVVATRTLELWLLENMSLAVVSCVSVNYDHDGYITQYRTIKDTPVMDSELCLDLGELVEDLNGLCGPVYEHINCRRVRPNSILDLTLVRSLGIVTYAIIVTSGEKKNAFPSGKTFSEDSVVFFQQPLEKTGIIACTVGNMIDKNCLRNQTVHADVLSGNHIPIAAAAQFLISRDMPGQGKLLQAGQGIQNFVRNLPSGFRSYKIQMNLRDFFKFPLSGF